MYQKKDLYKIYEKNVITSNYSKRLPDVTRRFTLSIINEAINCCDDWNNFLDIGSGNGHYSMPLLNKFKKGTAIEPSQNSDLKKISHTHKNFTVKNEYIQNIKFDEKFDFIMMVDLFEHIPPNELNSFVKSICKLQNAGGVIYLLTPNTIFCGPANQSDIYYKKHKDGHYKHYTKNEIINIFKKNNYELIISSYEEQPLRQLFKKIYWGISRRVKLFENNKFLNAISLPMVTLLKIFFNFLSWFVLSNETKYKNSKENAISIALVFKKIINDNQPNV